MRCAFSAGIHLTDLEGPYDLSGQKNTTTEPIAWPTFLCFDTIYLKSHVVTIVLSSDVVAVALFSHILGI